MRLSPVALHMVTFFKRCLVEWPAFRILFTLATLAGVTWVGIVPICLLAAYGVETKATITGTDPQKNYVGVYEFEVDGRPYRGSQGLEDAETATMLVGHQIPVTYSAKNPSLSLMGPKSKYGWATSIGLTFAMLGFVAVMSVVSLLVSRR